MRTLFENWDERNKFLAKRFFIRKWYMQVKKLRERDDKFDKALSLLDKKTLTDNVNTLADISTTHKYLKAVPVARASDFFNKLRKAWGDWSKIRIRILEIMGKYLESEEEKRINYLRRKLLQWNNTAKNLTKEINSSKIARWTERTYKTAVARNDWKKLTDKYDMFINKTALYQLKTRLSNWLKLRDFAEKLRNRFTIVGTDQFKQGIEFKKILTLMRTLFENWEERNQFLILRHYVNKWNDKVNKLKDRDEAFDKAMRVLDKKSLTDNVRTIADVSTLNKTLKALPLARASDFFNKLRRKWGDWSKIKIRILDIMGNHLENEDEKRNNILRI